VHCFSALLSGLTPPTPPPPVMKPPSAAADNQFVGAQLYLEQSATSRHFSTISTDFQEKAKVIFVRP